MMGGYPSASCAGEDRSPSRRHIGPGSFSRALGLRADLRAASVRPVSQKVSCMSCFVLWLMASIFDWVLMYV